MSIYERTVTADEIKAQNTMSYDEWWDKCSEHCTELNVSPGSNEAYDAAMNTTIKIGTFHYDVLTQESVDVFGAGLGSILEEKRR